MNQCGALRGNQALAEQFALALQALSQRQGEGGFNGGDAALGREQSRHFLLDLGALGSNGSGVVDAIELVGALTGATRTLAFGQQLLSKSDTGSGQVAFNQLVDYTQVVCFDGTDRVAADDHVQGLGNANQTRQALSAASTRQQAEFDFRQADFGALDGDAVVAADGNFQATAQCGAVDDRDARLAAGFDAVDHVGQARLFRRLAKFLDVRAGHEGHAFTDQYDRLYFRIGFCSLEALLQTFAHSDAQGIDRRVVHGDDRDGAFALQSDHIRHARSPSVLLGVFHYAK